MPVVVSHPALPSNAKNPVRAASPILRYKHDALATTHYLQSFDTLTNSFATLEKLTLLFSSSSKLLLPNTGGGMPGRRSFLSCLRPLRSPHFIPHPSPFFARISNQSTYSPGSAKNIKPKDLHLSLSALVPHFLHFCPATPPVTPFSSIACAQLPSPTGWGLLRLPRPSLPHYLIASLLQLPTLHPFLPHRRRDTDHGPRRTLTLKPHLHPTMV